MAARASRTSCGSSRPPTSGARSATPSATASPTSRSTGRIRCCACACSAQVEVGERPDPAVGRAVAWEAVRDAVRGEPAAGRARAGAAERAERARALVGSGARLRGAELRRRPRLARGRRPPAPPHPCRLRVRARRDHGLDPGRRGARAAQRRLPGLRPRDARLPARPGPAGPLRLGLPAHRSAAGPGPAARRRRLARLGRGLVAARTAGSSSTRPTTPAPTSATSRSPGAPTSPTSCRCAA